MRMRPSYILAGLIVMAVMAAVPGLAQEAPDTVSSLPGIEIETSVDHAEAYIGDLITYRVIVRYDSTIEMEPSPIGANLGGFDVKDYESDITTTLPDGRIQTENRFVLSTFTTGEYLIPPLPIVFTMPDGEKKVLLSESVPITVRSLLETAGDTADIKPAKPQFEFRRDMTPYYLWGGVILAVLLVGGFFLWRYLRKRKAVEEVIDTRPPWEIAFEKLALLKQEELPEQEQYKEYYFRLTELCREYLGRVYAINALDMTTEEFVEHVRDIDMPEESDQRTIEFLRHADLVKFARMEPENGRTERDFEFVHELIEQVRVDHLRQEAEREASLKQGHSSSDGQGAPKERQEPTSTSGGGSA